MKEDTIMENMVVGLDIGTTKTCAVIGFLNENKQIEVVGVGVAPSKGLKSGVIVNIDNTVASIIKAIDDAELMGGCEVNSVFVGITGQHIKGENSRGVVAVANRNRTITPVEMKRVIEAAQAIVIPMDREIIHVLSKEFSVDDQTGIKDPIGMSGVRLEAEVHIITGSTTSIQNLVKSVNKAGFVCNDIVFSPLASAESTLSRDEKDLGVALVDIGGGTTDIMVFIEGGVAYSAVLGIGGIHVTNDISIGLRTPIDSAEVIKKKYGCAVVDLVDASETIEVPSVGGRAPRRLFRHELAQIIEPRVIEIMEMIDNELAKSGKKEILAAGVVLTGGGSMIEGTVDAAERVLNMPVRVGLPENIVGLKDVVSTPMYANGVGLLRYGAKMGQLRQTRKTPGGLKSLKDKLRQIFNDYL
ncbi:MAG TPA: cell division protein FtsA [Spirochaetota bacterium]|nr:cell division protein FtsA [Spirochaetota bacterium]HQI37599.1 cell division protein FtsA [Spirochaetota bacterium]